MDSDLLAASSFTVAFGFASAYLVNLAVKCRNHFLKLLLILQFLPCLIFAAWFAFIGRLVVSQPMAFAWYLLALGATCMIWRVRNLRVNRWVGLAAAAFIAAVLYERVPVISWQYWSETPSRVSVDNSTMAGAAYARDRELLVSIPSDVRLYILREDEPEAVYVMWRELLAFYGPVAVPRHQDMQGRVRIDCEKGGGGPPNVKPSKGLISFTGEGGHRISVSFTG